LRSKRWLLSPAVSPQPADLSPDRRAAAIMTTFQPPTIMAAATSALPARIDHSAQLRNGRTRYLRGAYSAGPVAERGIAPVRQSQLLLRTVQATRDYWVPGLGHLTRSFLPMVVASGARSAGALGGRPRCESGGDTGCQMGWDPRRAGRQGQTPGTPGDPRKRAPGFAWRGTARLAARFPAARGRTPAAAVGR